MSEILVVLACVLHHFFPCKQCMLIQGKIGMKTLLLILASIGLGAAAIAQELPSFEEVDQNGDGMIDEAEASTVEGLDFTTADANQDGGIDQEEYSQIS